MTENIEIRPTRTDRLRWPWIPSAVTGALVLGAMLLLYAGRPLAGIALASATNMAAFAFFLVGGAVLVCRTASAPAPRWAIVVRPALVALIPALACWIVIIVLRQAILANEPLSETVFQDGYGRSIVVYQFAALIGVVAETVLRIRRLWVRR
ncbi:hypothetical protein [Micromonospora sp. NPDC047730]|uniref:hypothetical protein n=1 Tax=unclassified Micromonospora TaxID=2617518 RepID=UPI003715A962